MKLFTKMFLLVAFLSVTSLQIFSQGKDSLYIEPLPIGNLNEVINGDTTETGESAHIYVLQSDDEYDTPFFITEQLEIKNLMVVGKINPTTGHIPVVAVSIRDDGSSPGNIAQAVDNGYVHFKNLYLIGTRTDGSQVTQQCISSSDSCRITVENCVIEDFGSTGTPNILNTWNALGTDIIIKHCIFRNNQSDTPQNPGTNWAGPGVNAIDTMWVENSTFFFQGGNVEGSGSSMGYLHFDHNTIFMHTKSSPFSMRQMHNADITNSIFFSVYSAGLDSNHAFNSEVYNANFFSLPAVLTLDSLYSDLEGDPYFITEADRHVVAKNNAYFWPEAIMNNFDEMNADPDTSAGHPRNVGGKIYAPTWVVTRPGAEAILDLPNIQVAEEDNYNLDPGFDATMVQDAAEGMAAFVKHLWENNNSGVGARPFIYKAESPVFVYDNVPDDWKTTKGYPVQENLRFTNSTLLTADNGNPLGDLTWYPELGPVGVDDNPNTLPTEYNLSQNYPNPFNPTTTIKYSVPESGVVKLKVYNILGQEVASLVNKEQIAGEYTVDFDASQLASGIYMYSLTSGDVSITKKMLLLK